MWRISVGDDGTIDPTMTGCLIKPRTNMPHGPKKRLRPTRSRGTSGAFVCWACARGLVMMAFALLRLAKAWQNRDGRARKERSEERSGGNRGYSRFRFGGGGVE